MQPNLSNPIITEPTLKDIRDLANSYDYDVSYIDDGTQYREACERNASIIQILEYFGFTLKMTSMEPEVQSHYMVSYRTFKDLNDAIEYCNETIARILTSPYIQDKVQGTKEYRTIQKVEVIPDFSQGYWKLIPSKTTIKEIL